MTSNKHYRLKLGLIFVASIIVMLCLCIAPKLMRQGYASQLNGDINSDGTVSLSDLAILAAHWGLSSGATWSQGDLNNDGAVNLSVLAILAAH